MRPATITGLASIPVISFACLKTNSHKAIIFYHLKYFIMAIFCLSL